MIEYGEARMATLYFYVRTSTVEQRHGLDTQSQFLRDNIPAKYKSYPAIEIQEQLSAKTLEGRKLKTLLGSLKSEDVLFVYDASRLARNTEDLLSIIKAIFVSGAHLIIGLQEIDPNNYEQELQLSISGAIATYTRKVQNAKSKAGIKVAKRKGEWIFTSRILGYTLVGKKAEIVPKEAEIIRYLYEEYSKGKSINAICAELRKLGKYEGVAHFSLQQCGANYYNQYIWAIKSSKAAVVVEELIQFQ